MRYYGTPFLHIIDYEFSKEKFCFDESGIYETADEKLILWMKKNKPHIRCEEIKLNTRKKPTK